MIMVFVAAQYLRTKIQRIPNPLPPALRGQLVQTVKMTQGLENAGRRVAVEENVKLAWRQENPTNALILKVSALQIVVILAQLKREASTVVVAKTKSV